jgi:hypothetical protein
LNRPNTVKAADFLRLSDMTVRKFDLHWFKKGKKKFENSKIGYRPLSKIFSFPNAGVAQLAEHQPSKLRVAGSIPVSRSIVIKLYC